MIWSDFSMYFCRVSWPYLCRVGSRGVSTHVSHVIREIQSRDPASREYPWGPITYWIWLSSPRAYIKTLRPSLGQDFQIKNMMHIGLLLASDGFHGGWSVNEHRLPTVANLARAFLAIPANSAPSESVWSRASQVLSIRRARMYPQLAARIMYPCENNRLLHMYYEQLTGLSL